MKTYEEWRQFGQYCSHCLRPIEGRPVYEGGLVISGFEPMEWRHADDKKLECVITLKNVVKPPDQCGMRKLWEKSK